MPSGHWPDGREEVWTWLERRKTKSRVLFSSSRLAAARDSRVASATRRLRHRYFGLSYAGGFRIKTEFRCPVNEIEAVEIRYVSRRGAKASVF